MLQKHLFLCWFNEHTKTFKYQRIDNTSDVQKLSLRLQLQDKLPYNFSQRTLQQQADLLAKMLQSESVVAYTKESVVFDDPWDMAKELRSDLDTDKNEVTHGNFQLYSGIQ